MFDRKIAVLFSTFILVCGLNANALVSEYTIGDKEYKLSIQECIAVENSSVSNSYITMNGNSIVRYETSIPFPSSSVQLVYTGAQTPVDLTFIINGVEYSSVLSVASGKVDITFSTVEKVGDMHITIKANNSVKIGLIRFYKAPINVTYEVNQVETNLTAYEKLLTTAVVMSKDSPVIMVNGGKRYVNYDDPEMTPIIKKNIMYVPLKTFARAIGCYYETSVCKCFAILRNDTKEFCLNLGTLYKQIDSGEYVQTDNVFIIYNNEFYVPVRYFAEEFGKTVAYNDGIVIIDTIQGVKDILKSIYVNDLKNVFATADSIVTKKVYHVAQTNAANDNNAGSEQAPFFTLQKASSVAQAGDTVIVHEGTYREILKPQNNGTQNNPITFATNNNEKVIISANEAVDSYPSTEGDMLVYNIQAPLEQGRNQIFSDGEALCEGRHPNTNTALKNPNETYGLGTMWPTKGNFTVNEQNANIVTSDTELLQDEANYWKGATYVSRHMFAWALGTGRVTSSKSGSITLGDTTKRWWFREGNNYKTFYGYLTNHKNTVDVPNEWYVDVQQSKLYLIPPVGKTAETLKLEYKKRQLAVDLADSQYIQLKNISTIGGGIRLNNAEMCVINGGEHKYISHFTYSSDMREGFIDDANIYNANGAPQRGEVGVYIGGNDNAVLNAKIDWSAGAGIYAVGCYTYIENNVISNCGYTGTQLSGIFVDTAATGNLDDKRGGYGIFNNTIYNCGRSCVNITSNENWMYGYGLPMYIPSEIAYNEMYDGCLIGSDTGEYYAYGTVLGTDKLQERMHNNLIYKTNRLDSADVGMIYYDNYTQMAQVYNNVMFGIFGDIPDIYIQNHPAYYNSFATVDKYNNVNLGHREGGKASLVKEDFPSQKPFFAGSSLSNEEYRYNRDNFNK